MKILLDTNFFLIPCQFGVDIFEEFDRIIEVKYELFTIKSVVKELEGLSKEKSKDGKAARVGLELLKKKEIKIIKLGGNDADDSILKIAKKKDMVVATLDMELRKKLKKYGKKTIYLRGKKHLLLS